ncbi:hypothetical protein KEM60_00854 [Austwickia sp. TVS 96-490-7B]|nr:hypothetical protein [Austwickia sp. TVS 96-490-7B]
MLGWWVTADPAPDPGTAREWARQELAKDAYGESWIEKALNGIMDLIRHLFSSGPPGRWSIPVVAVLLGILLLVVVLALGLRWARRTKKPEVSSEDAMPVFDGPALTAATYRELAVAALARGDTATAVVEAFRSMAAGLIERHLLDEALDRTSGEFAQAVEATFDGFGDRARAASSCFDLARYGGGAPSFPEAQAMLTLEESLRHAAPRHDDPAEAVDALAAQG